MIKIVLSALILSQSCEPEPTPPPIPEVDCRAPPCDLGYDAVVDWGEQCLPECTCQFIYCPSMGDNMPYACSVIQCE